MIELIDRPQEGRIVVNYFPIVVKQLIDREYITVYGQEQETLTHWSRVTHVSVCKLTITGSDNGLSPGRCQAIIWTNAGILLIGPLGQTSGEILIEIHIFSPKKTHSKMSSSKCRPFCISLNVFRIWLPNSQRNSRRNGGSKSLHPLIYIFIYL